MEKPKKKESIAPPKVRASRLASRPPDMEEIMVFISLDSPARRIVFIRRFNANAAR